MISMTKQLKKLDQIWRHIIFTLPVVDNMNEFLITKFLLKFQKKIDPLNKYPYIFGYEYPLDPAQSDKGKIDLIMVNNDDKYLITEVKYISDRNGPTARKKRNTQKKKSHPTP